MKRKPALPDTDAACRAMGYIGDDAVRAILGVTDLTLRNRRSIGTAPPSYKVGNRHLTKIAELDAWIKRRYVNKAVA